MKETPLIAGNRHGGYRPRPSLRGVGVALFVASAVIQIAGPNPEKGMAHVRCAEHGELTHAAAAPGPSNLANLSGLPHAAVKTDAAPGSENHEHCPYAAVLDQPAPTVSPAGALAAATWTPPPRSLRLDGGKRCPPRLVLDCAPKTSPPSA